MTMRMAWILLLVCGVALTGIGIKVFHGQDTTEVLSTTVCLECLETKVVTHDVVYAKGIEIGFREGRFDILTREDVEMLSRSLAVGKRRMTIVLFSSDCEGCAFAEKLVRELSAVNPAFFKVEILRKTMEGFDEAKAKYGFAEVFPTFFLIDRYGNVRATVSGMDGLKDKIVEWVISLEEKG